MAKKDDFDFDAESGGKFKFDLSFLANLTKQQKGIILIAAVALVLVIAIVVTVVLIGANSKDDIPEDLDTNEGEHIGDGGNNEVPDEISQFYISSNPTKTSYYVGDNADYSGLTVYFKSESTGSVFLGYDEDPDAFTITGFDSSAPVEEQVITVECRGYTDTFTVTILEKETAKATLIGITVDPLPRTTYPVGYSFETTGAYIVCEYSDGTTESVPLTMKHISGFGAIAYTPGEHQIKVKYADDNGGYAETYITVTITE